MGGLPKEFFAAYSKHDGAMKLRIQTAHERGCVLRYVGVLQGESGICKYQEIPRQHLLASAQGSDNIVAFTTHRYARSPLVVQGPGAGAEVTAMGVFSDLLKLLHYLPQ